MCALLPSIRVSTSTAVATSPAPLPLTRKRLCSAPPVVAAAFPSSTHSRMRTSPPKLKMPPPWPAKAPVESARLAASRVRLRNSCVPQVKMPPPSPPVATLPTTSESTSSTRGEKYRLSPPPPYALLLATTEATNRSVPRNTSIAPPLSFEPQPRMADRCMLTCAAAPYTSRPPPPYRSAAHQPPTRCTPSKCTVAAPETTSTRASLRRRAPPALWRVAVASALAHAIVRLRVPPAVAPSTTSCRGSTYVFVSSSISRTVGLAAARSTTSGSPACTTAVNGGYGGGVGGEGHAGGDGGDGGDGGCSGGEGEGAGAGGGAGSAQSEQSTVSFVDGPGAHRTKVRNVAERLPASYAPGACGLEHAPCSQSWQ